MRWVCVLVLGACARAPDGTPRDTPPPAATTPPAPTTSTPPITSVPPFSFEVSVETVLDVDTAIQMTTNVRLAPLGLAAGVELLCAEGLPGRLTWVVCDGTCDGAPFDAGGVGIPARTATADVDGDGDTDVVVADLGSLAPTDDRVGAVWLLRRDGADFLPELLIDGLPRVACAEPGDLDGDGDLDLAVCAFGNFDGSVGWLEQGAAGWTWHVLDKRPGAIHAFPADFDGDGDLDVAVGISQLDEEVMLYRNLGGGVFRAESVHDRSDTWFGLSGIEPVDLDQDGDLDLLLTNGDSMDWDLPDDQDPEAVHGVAWLENHGDGRFDWRDIFRAWGAYAVRAVDLDGDDDLDLVLGDFQNTSGFPDLPTHPLQVLENDGAQRFTAHEVPGAPPQLITLEVADVDGDGDPDILAGSMGVDPAQSAERLVLLRNVGAGSGR